MEPTKTQLRKRWKKAEFTNEILSLLSERKTIQEDEDRPALDPLVGIDLRGAPKFNLDGPFADVSLGSLDLLNLTQLKISQVDLSYADGSLIAGCCVVKNAKILEFKFDRSSRFGRAEFFDCDFSSAYMRLDANECVFNRCKFDLSTFAGGFQEYGFKLCKFNDCSFAGIRWERVALQACEFRRCDFRQAQIIDGYVPSFKNKDCKNFSADVFFSTDQGYPNSLPRLLDLED